MWKQIKKILNCIIKMQEPPAEDSIKVVCRFRPLNDIEENAGSKFIAEFPLETEECLSLMGKLYVFDRIFNPSATQENVYNEAAKPIVKDVLMGYNGTIFVYGQTSSGKTHTMEGVLGDPVQEGIMPRIVDDIFNHIYSLDENIEFRIKVSYFEIYLDKIRDLLDVSKTNLSVREDENRVPYVKGATERFVTSPEEVMEVIDEGKANRHIAVTNMNERSSRSHSIFLINIKQENLENQKKLSGKLYLVDLAGSEKISKTGAEGMVLDEVKNVNKSLSALGNVTSALADKNKSHIPYRDSKLTRILQESLGGNSRTTIIICCSPASYNESETKSTLEFGRRAKMIKNTAIVNKELTAEEWKRRYQKLKEKVTKLKEQLSRAEVELNRWRSGESVPQDEQLLTKDLEVSTLSFSEASSITSIPATPPQSSRPLSNDELMKFEEERAHLYAQLDEKDDEIEHQNQLIEKLKEQILEQKKATLNNAQNELQQLKNNSLHQNKRITEILSNLSKGFGEIGVVLGGIVTDIRPINQYSRWDLAALNELNDANDTTAIACEGTPIQIATTTAPSWGHTSTTNIGGYWGGGDNTTSNTWSGMPPGNPKAPSAHWLEQNHSANSNSMGSNTQAAVSGDKSWDMVNDQGVSSWNEEMHIMASKEKEKDSAGKMKEALEQQFEKHWKSHQKQLAQLKDEIAEKQTDIDQLKDATQKLTLAQERMQMDYDKLKQEEKDKAQKLQELTFMSDGREQAQGLNNPSEKTVIACDNTDLRCELPKLEKRLDAYEESIKTLVQDLKEAKENAMNDRRRFYKLEKYISEIEEHAKYRHHRTCTINNGRTTVYY